MKNKLLLLPILITVLSGCFKTDGNITISCEGEKIIRNRNGNMWDYVRTEKYEKDYIFVNKKLSPYECSWGDRNIVCKSNPISDDLLSVVINLDREKGKVTELFTIRNKDGTGTHEMYNGKCKKLDKQF